MHIKVDAVARRSQTATQRKITTPKSTAQQFQPTVQTPQRTQALPASSRHELSISKYSLRTKLLLDSWTKQSSASFTTTEAFGKVRQKASQCSSLGTQLTGPSRRRHFLRQRVAQLSMVTMPCIAQGLSSKGFLQRKTNEILLRERQYGKYTACGREVTEPEAAHAKVS